MRHSQPIGGAYICPTCLGISDIVESLVSQFGLGRPVDRTSRSARQTEFANRRYAIGTHSVASRASNHVSVQSDLEVFAATEGKVK
jgi:hypothetical protein